MFVDHIKIHAKAGDGGDGAMSFRREKFVPKGGPDGGDGGKGGDVVLVVDENVDTLAGFFYEPIIKAKNGEKGHGANCYGKGAKPTFVKVPVGTLVYRIPTDAPKADSYHITEGFTFVDLEKEAEEEKAALATAHAAKESGGATRTGETPIAPLELVIDLTKPGEQFVLCRGGKGGKGNVHFKSSRNRVPRQFTPGEEGEEGDFYLELRKIADAGLVGYPNAGKSTLLSKISAAHPKVAPYPFTTLHPMVGVVDFDGFKHATVADIPGLIEGAHRNIGLGHEFLRHVVRCKLLIHVVDVAGSEGRNPVEDLNKIREELKLYDPGLIERPWIIVANKVDLPDAEENLKALKRHFKKVKVFPVSAESGKGMDAFKAKLGELIGVGPEEREPISGQEFSGS